MKTTTMLGMAIMCANVGIAAQAAPKQLTLVKAGQPAATIVLAARPTRAAQMGALDLQWHVQQMTGATLPISDDKAQVKGVRILVGASNATRTAGVKDDFKPQEYLIRFRPDTLILMGADKADYGAVRFNTGAADDQSTWPDIFDAQASMYAVYDFLQNYCGVRWFNPTETGIDLPHSPDLVVAARDLKRSPFMLTRDAVAQEPPAEQYDAYTALWARNTAGFKAFEAAAYPALHTKFPAEWEYSLAKRGQVRLFQQRLKGGGEKCHSNHSFYEYYDRFWAKNPAAPQKFEGHRPELFAKGYEGAPPQMDYTNPETAKQVAKDAREYFAKGDPTFGYRWGKDYFSIEPMDNSDYSRDERTQAFLKAHQRPAQNPALFSSGVSSDLIFNFVNMVAREVRKTNPDKIITTLAYAGHADLPSFKLEPNVRVFFCFTTNRMPYDRLQYDHEMKLLQRWVKAYPDRPMYLWLYDTFPVEIANGGQWHTFPGFFAQTVDKQFKQFYRDGIKGVFHCGYGQDVEAYLTFRLMDDPTLNADQVLKDYFNRLYGPAGQALQTLYNEIEKTYTDTRNWPSNGGHMSKTVAWTNLGTPARMQEYSRLMEQATNAASKSGTPLQQKRVELFRMAVWDYMVAGRAQQDKLESARIPKLNAPRIPDAGGDVSKVDWSQAAPLENWHQAGVDLSPLLKVAGRIAHDGKWVYLELSEATDPRKLIASPLVFPFDSWEIFIAKQRGLPYRQYAFGPTGLIHALSHGEVNFRRDVELEGHGVKIVSDVSAPDKWTLRAAFPLGTTLKDSLQPNDTFYMNIIRATRSTSGIRFTDLDSWVSYASVHDVDRLAEITLQ